MDNKTNAQNDHLVKGFKILGVCLLLMFLGPSMFHLVLSNSDKPFYIVLLVISGLLCVTAIVLLFVGILTIVNAIFKNK